MIRVRTNWPGQSVKCLLSDSFDADFVVLTRELVKIFCLSQFHSILFKISLITHTTSDLQRIQLKEQVVLNAFRLHGSCYGRFPYQCQYSNFASTPLAAERISSTAPLTLWTRIPAKAGGPPRDHPYTKMAWKRREASKSVFDGISWWSTKMPKFWRFRARRLTAGTGCSKGTAPLVATPNPS